MQRMLLVLWACCVLVGLSMGAKTAAAAKDGFNPDPLRAQAMALYQQGKVLESLELWHAIYRLSQSGPQKAEALVMLADINAMFLDRKDRAMGLYEKGIALGGEPRIIARAWYNLGMLRYGAGRYEDARAAFTAYLKFFPHGPKAERSKQMLARLKLHGSAPLKDDVTPIPVPRQEPVVRVALSHVSALSVTPPPGAVAGYGSKRARILANTLQVGVRDGKIALNDRVLDASVTLFARKGEFKLGDAHYAGTLELHAQEGKVLVVNYVPLEQYVAGVVPCEMPTSFKPHALRAQAVAARTHALYMLLRSKERIYDVWATTASQVYGGTTRGNATTTAAVRDTRGKVLLYDSGVALAFYHSHSGGTLENDVSVWKVDMPYYKARPDPASTKIKAMKWQHSIKKVQIAEKLKQQGYPVKTVQAVRVLQRSASGRVARVRITTDSGAVDMNSNPFRLMVGAAAMKSTLCTIESGKNTVVFRGAGYGHGVGMSQWGAEGMARDGVKYENILQYHYPGTLVRAIY